MDNDGKLSHVKKTVEDAMNSIQDRLNNQKRILSQCNHVDEALEIAKLVHALKSQLDTFEKTLQITII